MNIIEKKSYSKPAIKVRDVKIKHHLLSGSPTEGKAILSDEYDDDYRCSKSSDFTFEW